MKTKTIAATFVVLCSIGSQVRADTEFDRDYQKLKDQRDKALAAAAEPINRQYKKSLEQLFTRASQAGSVELAVQIKAELKALDENAAVNQPTPLFGRWRAVYSKTDNDIVTIREDKTASCAKGPVGVWDSDAKYMTIGWNNGIVFRISLTLTGDTIRGEKRHGNETRWDSFTLTRE